MHYHGAECLTVFFHLLEVLWRHLQRVDVFLDHFGPPFQALHHVPRLRQVDHDHDCRVSERVFLEDEGEKLTVPDNTVENPDPHAIQEI